MTKTVDLAIRRGSTFRITLRYETEPIVYKGITAISKTAPIRITCPSHGLKDGWYVAISDVQGMTQINAESNSPKDKDYRRCTVIDDDTIEINEINAASFSTYKGGGVVRYNTPVSLSGCTARMDIKDKEGGTVLLALDSTSEITLDDTEHTITVELAESVTKDITWSKGVYDLEIVTATGEVSCPIEGAVIVDGEITTSE